MEEKLVTVLANNRAWVWSLRLLCETSLCWEHLCVCVLKYFYSFTRYHFLYMVMCSLSYKTQLGRKKCRPQVEKVCISSSTCGKAWECYVSQCGNLPTAFSLCLPFYTMLPFVRRQNIQGSRKAMWPIGWWTEEEHDGSQWTCSLGSPPSQESRHENSDVMLARGCSLTDWPVCCLGLQLLSWIWGIPRHSTLNWDGQ